MERMNALETYPSHHHSKNEGNDDQYDHVARKFDRNSKCGTLSKTEWEAISEFRLPGCFRFWMLNIYFFFHFSRFVYGFCLQENENGMGRQGKSDVRVTCVIKYF